MTQASEVREFLALLRAEPTLMAAAPHAGTFRPVASRAASGFPCRRCGRRAQLAYVAEPTTAGPRWLDLCAACASWMTKGLEQAELEEELAAGPASLRDLSETSRKATVSVEALAQALRDVG